MHHKRRSRRSDSKYICCTYCTPDPMRKAPVDSEVCMGKVKAKKPRPKKDKCPVNRVHEWYVEEETEIYYGWYTDKEYVRRYKVFTCIHCWKVKQKLIREQ